MAKITPWPAYLGDDVATDGIDPELLKRFRAEFARVHKRVLAYAVVIVRRKRWTHDGTGLPEGKEAVDLVHEAVELVLNGTRKWNPAKIPDLDVYLYGVMRSQASHLVTGGSSKETGEVEAIEAGGALPMAPRPLTLAPDHGLRCEALVKEAFDAAGTDPVCDKIIEAVLAGCEKAEDIAEEAKLSRDTVYEGLRRLRRRLDTAANRRKS
jgi:DNA-directed RNA polymerase specialized sigma24 family protein